MDYVLTLIGKNIAPLAERARQQFGGSLTWLGENEACDIAPLAASALPLIKEHAFGAVDFAFQPCANRKKKLLASDMDSTIIKEETIDLLATLVGAEKEVARITEKAMQGQIDFATALAERVSLLKGIKEDEVKSVLDKITICAGAKTLSATMTQHGAPCLLLSGGFDILVSAVAKQAGFTAGECNRLQIKNGELTGALIAPIYDASTKKQLMLNKAKELGIESADIIAVGDGANDIAMIEAAGLGVCFGDKKILAQKADIQIQHNDLTALLYVQGYLRSEFI